MADGCLGMMALGAKEVTGDDKFKLGKAYTLRKLADLEALGVTSENNPNLYRNVKEFYAEAGDGTDGVSTRRPNWWPCFRRRSPV